MSEQGDRLLYEGPPIRTWMAAWLLLGVGGLVLVPIGLMNRAWWLVILAVPPLLVGLVLLQARHRIVVQRGAGVVRVVDFVGILRLRQRQYPLADVVGIDVQRRAGAERERPSDTWYVVLQIHTTSRSFGKVKPRLKTYLIGRYDSRLKALQARHRSSQVLRARPQVWAAGETQVTTEPEPLAQPQGADGQYQEGLALLRSGDVAGARQAFQRAQALAQEPLLRRMAEQRLEELDRR